MFATDSGEVLRRLKCVTKTRCFLPILILIALALRLIPLRFEYFLGYDTYFHATYVEYSARIGEWVNFFPYANAPWGMLIDQFHPKGFWMPPVYVHGVLRPFGVSIETAFKVTPVLVGLATIVLVYFALKSLYNGEVATLSSLFLAISFGHVFRSMANYYRGDNYILLWYSIALLGTGLALQFAGRGDWRYRRLAFYIIPGLTAGMAAAFWSAYYLIFVFLLSMAIFMAIGAILLRREWAILDSIALTASAAMGALIANELGARLGYGMFGWNRPDGIEAAKSLGLHFGFMKDAFLLVYIKYAVPVALVLIVLLFAAMRLIKSERGRTAFVAALLLAGALLGIRYYGLIEGVFLQFIQRFGEEAIAETRRTSIHDLWISYGTLAFAAPLFLLRLRPSRAKVADFIVLSFALPSIIMVAIWTRFLFIGSLAIAVLAGIGTLELAKKVKDRQLAPEKMKTTAVVAILMFILVVPTLVVALQNALNLRPFMDDGWKGALEALERVSNENDVVLTWWDQVYWVTYYAHRGALPGSTPNEFVAKYYVGMVGRDELTNLGVDYVIVSYDTVRKFPAVLKTAGVPVKDYPMIPMPLVETNGRAMVFSVDGYSITAEPLGEKWRIIVSAGGSVFSPVRAYVEGAAGPKEVNATGAPKANAYVYINPIQGYAVLMNRNAFDTTLARLMFTDDYPQDYSLVYSDGGYIKIFKLEHPNVAVVREENGIVLRFTNATGNYLVIEGFLDNGTRVFMRLYEVSGMDEFTLPEQLNGSVVVRYSYETNGKVLDRGVFRIEDVQNPEGQ